MFKKIDSALEEQIIKEEGGGIFDRDEGHEQEAVNMFKEKPRVK
jgi:hypothetical protein